MHRLARGLCCTLAAIVLVSVPAFAQYPQFVDQVGHIRGITSVAFVPGTHILLTGAEDGNVKLWNADSGHVYRTISTGDPEIWSLAVSPDGKQFATGSGGPDAKSAMVRIFDLDSGKEARHFPLVPIAVPSLAWSADGKLLAAGCSDASATVWDVSTGAVVHTTPAFPSTDPDQTNDAGVDFSHDGKLLAVAAGGSLHILDVGTWHEIASAGSIPSHPSVSFSIDDRLVVYSRSGSDDDKSEVALFDFVTRTARTLPDAKDVIGFRFTPSGELAVATSATVAFWNAGAGKKLGDVPGASYVAVSSDEKLLATGDYKSSHQEISTTEGTDVLFLGTREIALYDYPHRRPLRTLTGYAREADLSNLLMYSIAISPEGTTVVRRVTSPLGGGSIRMWDVTTSLAPESMEGIEATSPLVTFSPDGRYLALTGTGGIAVYDSTTGNVVGLKAHHVKDPDAGTVLAFSGDSTLLAYVDANNGTSVWNVAKGGNPRVLPGKFAGAWKPGTHLFATTNRLGAIAFYNADTGLPAGTSIPAQGVEALAFDPAGKLLAAGTLKGTVSLYDAASHRLLRTWKDPSGNISTASFSPDGALLATSGGADDHIRLWNPQTGQLLHTLATAVPEGISNDGKTPFVFSPNGKLILRGTRNMRVFDVATGRELLNIVAVGDQDWFAVTPEGLFDGSPQGWQALVWRLGPGLTDVAPGEVFFNELFYPGLLPAIFEGKTPTPVRAISDIDRRQPTVELGQVGELGNHRNAKLRIAVAEAPPDASHSSGSGARDLRLFRNGTLVKLWHALSLGPGGAVVETEVPVVAGANHFTAYAFSSSDIKSADADLDLTGSDQLKRDGIAYVLAIGINHYATLGQDLKYAVADARDFSREFAARQAALKNYGQVKVTTLTDAEATRANVLAALERLAGAPLDHFTPEQQKLFSNLAPAQPEDGFFLYYAGHGTASGDRFYLIPYDVSLPSDTAAAPGNTISDLDLEAAFEKIDVGRSLFVIDACRSGRLLESAEWRVGPMNSKGIAQLAYEKGMDILTASQGYQSALEASLYGHGFLTYALVEEGLKTTADAVDGKVELRNWLDYATTRVPELQMQFLHDTETKRGTSKLVDDRNYGLQHPRVFYRRDPENQPFLVAAPGPSQEDQPQSNPQ